MLGPVGIMVVNGTRSVFLMSVQFRTKLTSFLHGPSTISSRIGTEPRPGACRPLVKVTSATEKTLTCAFCRDHRPVRSIFHFSLPSASAVPALREARLPRTFPIHQKLPEVKQHTVMACEQTMLLLVELTAGRKY